MLYIIRHGKTDWNVAKKLQGWTDIPLNEQGISMAREAAKENKEIDFDICFCSPLTRARQTAELFLEGKDTPIIIDERIKEMGFGEYEGITNYFEDSSCPVNVFFTDPKNYKGSKNGESTKDLLARTKDFLEDKVYPLLKEGKNVLIVGHGAANSSIICNYLNRDVDDFWKESIANCKLINLDALKAN